MGKGKGPLEQFGGKMVTIVGVNLPRNFRKGDLRDVTERT